MSVATFEFPATVEEFIAEAEAFYTERLGERCEWSDLPSKTCGHCIYGYRAAYMDFPSVEELWN